MKKDKTIGFKSDNPIWEQIEILKHELNVNTNTALIQMLVAKEYKKLQVI